MPPRRTLTRRDWLYASGVLALAGCAGPSDAEPIWIGHIGPVGGRGESAINGMQQTLADRRDNGVTVGGRTIGVRHVEAKDKARVRAEASRLLAVNRVVALIVGPGVDGVADAVAVAKSHGAIAVILDGTADHTPADQAIWLGTDAETRGAMLARYAIAKGKRRYTTSLPSRNEVVDGFDRQFVRSGGTRFDPKIPTPYDVILGPAGEPGSRVEKSTPTILLGPSPPVLDGEVWRLTMQPDAAGVPEGARAWVERFQKRFATPPDDDAITAADAVLLIADGLDKVGDDRRKLAEDLAGRTEFAGLMGPTTSKDGRAVRRMGVERVVKGKRVGIDAVPAEN